MKKIFLTLLTIAAWAAPAGAVDLAAVFGTPNPVPIICTFSLSKPVILANGSDSTIISLLLNGVASSAPVTVSLLGTDGVTVRATKPGVSFPITATSSAPGTFTFSASSPSNAYNCPATTIMAH